MFLLSSACISRNECENVLHVSLEITLFTGFGDKQKVNWYIQCIARSSNHAALTYLLGSVCREERNLCILQDSVWGLFCQQEKNVTLCRMCCQTSHLETVSWSAESFPTGSCMSNLLRRIYLARDHINSPWNLSPWLKLQLFPGFIAFHMLMFWYLVN